MRLNLTIDDGLALKVGFLELEHCTIGPSDSALEAELDSLLSRVAASYALETLSTEPVVRSVRALFKSAGMDPSRYRPSSEALLRRVLKGQRLNRVNTIVDINNACSLSSRLPLGSYDRSRLIGDVHLRLGEPGESYSGITRVIDNTGKIVAVDERGPFGSPIADSERSMVREDTHRVLVLVYAPSELSNPDIESVLTDCAALASEYAGASPSRRGIAGR